MTHPISRALGIADEDDTMTPNPTPNLPAQEEMVEDFETVRNNTNSLIRDGMSGGARTCSDSLLLAGSRGVSKLGFAYEDYLTG